MITKDQSHRVLEAVQRVALSVELQEEQISQLDHPNKRCLELSAKLIKENVEAIGNMIVGMLNGGGKKNAHEAIQD